MSGNADPTVRLTPEIRRKKIGDVLRVASGNFLEQYDFFGGAFFPTDDPFASLMLSFANFGVGFLMRPLGAVILEAYIHLLCRFGFGSLTRAEMERRINLFTRHVMGESMQ